MIISFILWIFLLADNGILSTTVEENHCDLYPCIDDHLMIPVLNSTFVKCIKRSHCALSGNVSLFPVSQKSLFHLSFESISVKQKDEDFLIQLRLSSALSDDFFKEGHQTSLILKISFGKGIACYEFSIPFSFFKYFKDDFVLPCFRIPSSYKHELKLVLFAYWNDPFKSITEICLVQAVNYSLRNVTEVHKFKGNVFKTTYDFDSKNFYLIMNRTVDSQCLFYHNISIFESSHDNICNKHKPVVHRWVSFSRKSCDSVSYSRSNFTSSQQYCIHAVFKKSRDCELLYPDNFIEIFFFQLPGDVKNNNSELETSICNKWNLTMDTKINEGNISFKFKIWCPFVKCFSSYQLCLCELKSRECSLNGPIRMFCHNVTSGFDEEISRVFLNVPPGCYTFMVLPVIDNKIIKNSARNYVVFNVTGNKINKENQESTKPKFPIDVLLAMGFCLCFAGCVLWSYSKSKLRMKMKNEGNKGFPVEKSTIEDIPLLIQDIKEIYIFHSQDDDSVKIEVNLLKDFLQKCAEWTVCTLNDKLHEIMKQRYNWLTNILECGCSEYERSCGSKRRFIFVISAKTLHDFGSNSLLSNEERIFLNALLRIKTSTCRHIFMIVFNEGLCNDSRFPKLEPMKAQGTTYVIPEDLVDLCMSLGCSSEEEIRRCLDEHDIRNIGS
ncbi:uncharacterized protein TNCT_731611 [Trichonephila clavata]|uniref:SEFIR domain-containing protein n=1 Tax=Trichonephila clavata TaxID=2740835 RepID=A0A8X6IDS1_TRICU|nr:uncharacterized protein TNCT_731611 [Trichonephila clavata]